MSALTGFLIGIAAGAVATLAGLFGVLAWIWRIPRDLTH